MNNSNNNNKKYNEMDVIRHLKFIDVVKTLSDGVIVIDDKRNIIYVSSIANTIFGYKRDELIGKSHDILVPMQFKEKHKEHCVNYFLNPKTMPIGGIHQELKGIRKNGDEFYIDVGISPVNTERGLLAISIVRDISENKKAQDKLMESEKRMKSTLDSMLEGCQIIGYDWRYLYVNDAITKQGRKTKEELLGKTMMEAYPGIENTEMFSHLRRCMEKRISYHMENEFTYTDGSKNWFELSIQPVPKGIFILSIDITERKKFENALALKKKELLSQVKLTSDFLDILERIATSLNFHESMNKILPSINDMLGSQHCFVYCLNSKDDTLQPSHQLNLAQESLAYFVSSYIRLADYESISTNTDIIFSSTAKLVTGLNYNIQKLLKQILSKFLLIIPIAYERKLQSLIICSYSQKMTFSNKQQSVTGKLQKLLESRFMAQVHSLNLLSKTMEFTQQLQMSDAMSSIDRSVLSSSNEEEIVFGTIKQFWKVIPSEITEILKYNSDSLNYDLIATYENEQIVISHGESFTEKDLRSRMSIKFGITNYYPDIAKEELLGKYERRFLKKDYSSLMVIPLLARGEPVGLLTIANRNASAYSPNHLSVAQRLGDQVAIGLSNIGLIKQLQDLLIGTIKSLIVALDAKSKWTQGHSERVSETSLKLGKVLGLNNSQLYELKLAALFHDIGKVGTYDSILEKSEKLSEEEIILIKKHPAKTYEILQPIPKLKPIASYALHHHERWDGSGYPNGLAGDNIPFFSRIITLADAYDAMSSDRPYRKKFSIDKIIDEIQNLSGSQFDPEIADVFISIIRKQPKEFRQKAKAA